MIKKIVGLLLVLFVLAACLMAFRLYTEGVRSQEMELSHTWPFSDVEPCPESPNCVSTNSESNDAVHYIESQTFEENPIDEIDRIFGVMKIRTVQRNETSIVGTHQSKLFGFVDDISFVWDSETGRLTYRSASRVGHSDLGANRKRLEGILFQLNQFRR